MSPEELKELADRVNAALAGQVGRDDKARRELQDILQGRVRALFRLKGKRVGELKHSDPALYERFLLGCQRAIVRYALTRADSDGYPPFLSHDDLAYLRRKELNRRDLNQYDELADIADNIPVTFYDSKEIDDESERRFP